MILCCVACPIPLHTKFSYVSASISSFANYRLIIGVAVTLTSTGYVIWLYDPYAKFSWHSRSLEEGSTDPALLSGSTGWEAKSVLGRAYPHNAVVIGTSKLLDTDPKELAFFNFFNASIGAINLDEISDYVDSLDTHVKLVVIGIDFFQFNENFLPLQAVHDREQLRQVLGLAPKIDEITALLSSDWGTTTRYLLNGRALLKATNLFFQTPPSSCAREIVLYPQGNYNKLGILWQTEFRETNTRKILEENYRDQIEHLRTVNYANFKYSEHREKTLRTIRDKLRAKGIPLIGFLDPLNDRELPLLKEMGLSESYKRFISATTQTFGDSAIVPLQEYGDPSYYYDFDPIHFLPETGAEIINRMVANHFDLKLPTDFKMYRRLSDFVPLSSTSGPNESAARAFDRTIATGWVASESDQEPWIGARFSFPQRLARIVLSQLKEDDARRSSVIIETSLDGRKWIPASPPICSSSKRTVIDISGDRAASYWRVAPVDGGVAPWRVDELAFYERRTDSDTVAAFKAHSGR